MTVLTVQQLSKGFTFYSSPFARLKARLFNRPTGQHYQALTNINFTLAAGESVGILGKNGAGKSTLLKLITGILLPDTGIVHHEGRITGLLELGTGFDANLTGRENIRVNGLLLGMSESELVSQVDAIIAFAELGDYIDHPVRTYSSGMVMRLGFAIAIHASPSCLIVDEALAVGDARFQQKCVLWMQAFQSRGGTLLFVSHDLALVKQLCQRVLVLEGGRLVFQGNALEGANYYETSLLEQATQTSVNCIDQQDIQLHHVAWLEDDGREAHLFSGGHVILRIQLHIVKPHENLSLGFMIRNRLGQDLFGINTAQIAVDLPTNMLGLLQVDYPMTLNLGAGEYLLFIALHDKDDYTKNVHIWEQSSMSFTVHNANQIGVGQVYCPVLKPSWSFVE